jgi:hypothetical protein
VDIREVIVVKVTEEVISVGEVQPPLQLTAANLHIIYVQLEMDNSSLIIRLDLGRLLVPEMLSEVYRVRLLGLADVAARDLVGAASSARF